MEEATSQEGIDTSQLLHVDDDDEEEEEESDEEYELDPDQTASDAAMLEKLDKAARKRFTITDEDRHLGRATLTKVRTLHLLTMFYQVTDYLCTSCMP